MKHNKIIIDHYNKYNEKDRLSLARRLCVRLTGTVAVHENSSPFVMRCCCDDCYALRSLRIHTIGARSRVG